VEQIILVNHQQLVFIKITLITKWN
jgi:hypothetical protein